MGVLRIFFTSDDLARTRFATRADPLWELVLSRFRMAERDRSPAFQPWLRQLADNRQGVARIRRGVHLLGVLAPPCPYFPDFLTPPEARQGLDAGLEALMSTPRRRLRANPELPPVLVYPIDEDLRQWTTQRGYRPLESLLGRTRASVLHAINIGATFTQLARKLGVSTASVSRHAAALRDAQLIASHRHGAAVLHTLTQLGTDLLRTSHHPKGRHTAVID
jgi:DNA-binding MarR family transcriptional regulator